MVLTGEHKPKSHWTAITSIASKIGGTTETLRPSVKEVSVDCGIISSGTARLKALEREAIKVAR